MTPADMPSSSFATAQRQFTAHLRAPQTVAPPTDVAADRMALYRELVYGNLERMLANLFPVLRKITPDVRWFALVQDFVQRHQCRAGLFTRVPQEFLQFIEAERDPIDDPPFLPELVHYEVVDYAVTIDPREIEWAGVDSTGDLLVGVPVLNPLARLLSYRYPVHRIAPTFLPTAPTGEQTYLVVCRDREDKVSFLDLNPVSARLLALIDEGHGITGRAMLERIALELGHHDPDLVVAGGAEILTRLRARDVLLGVRA